MTELKTWILFGIGIIGFGLSIAIALITQSLIVGVLIFIATASLLKVISFSEKIYQSVVHADEYERDRKQTPASQFWYFLLHSLMDETRFGWVGAERTGDVVLLIHLIIFMAGTLLAAYLLWLRR